MNWNKPGSIENSIGYYQVQGKFNGSLISDEKFEINISQTNVITNKGIGAYSYAIRACNGPSLCSAWTSKAFTIKNSNPITEKDYFNINEDSDAIILTLTNNDIDKDGHQIIVTKVNSATLGTTWISNNKVYYRPNLNSYGTDELSYTVSDGNGGLATGIAVVKINPVNDSPTISNITNKTINEDSNTGSILFTINDIETSTNSLVLSKTSSNTALVPTSNIVFGGSGGNRTVKITPAPNQYGSATITVNVSDGGITKSDSFVVTVNSVNDSPTISNIADITINEDNNTGNIPFTINDIETSTNSLVLSKTSSNTALVPTSNIVFGGSGANRTVKITPAPNQYDSATITVNVSDGGITKSDSFVVKVNAVNDEPVISGTPKNRATINSIYSFSPKVFDIDNDKEDLSFSIEGKPEWANFNTATGEFSGTPLKQNLGEISNITISVSDGEHTNSLETFKVKVTKMVVFIHTDLLGTPIIETNEKGEIN